MLFCHTAQAGVADEVVATSISRCSLSYYQFLQLITVSLVPAFRVSGPPSAPRVLVSSRASVSTSSRPPFTSRPPYFTRILVSYRASIFISSRPTFSCRPNVPLRELPPGAASSLVWIFKYNADKSLGKALIDRYANMDDETCLPELSPLHLHP